MRRLLLLILLTFSVLSAQDKTPYKFVFGGNSYYGPRNASVTWLAERYDVGIAGLADWPQVELFKADMEAGEPFPLKGRTFDGVIVTNYLWRPVLADIVACVADDGILIYETFARGHEKFGRPTNKDFLLTRNELIKAVLPNMTIVAFEHGLLDGENPKVVQRIVAGGRQRGLTG